MHQQYNVTDAATTQDETATPEPEYIQPIIITDEQGETLFVCPVTHCKSKKGCSKRLSDYKSVIQPRPPSPLSPPVSTRTTDI